MLCPGALEIFLLHGQLHRLDSRYSRLKCCKQLAHNIVQRRPLVPPHVYLLVLVSLSRSAEVVTKKVNLNIFTPSETSRGLSQVYGVQERATPIEESRPKSLEKLSPVELTNR